MRQRSLSRGLPARTRTSSSTTAGGTKSSSLHSPSMQKIMVPCRLSRWTVDRHSEHRRWRLRTYLESFATDVAGYGARTGQGVIIGFGHEMNGSWYPWGYRHVAPALFVAAWRHIVKLFRQQGADDVTWLWTVNIISGGRIPSPAPWWPGSAYVTWVGIDGYYFKPSWSFLRFSGRPSKPCEH